MKKLVLLLLSTLVLSCDDNTLITKVHVKDTVKEEPLVQAAAAVAIAEAKVAAATPTVAVDSTEDSTDEDVHNYIYHFQYCNGEKKTGVLESDGKITYHKGDYTKYDDDIIIITSERKILKD